MSERKRPPQSIRNIRRIQAAMIIGYALIVIIAVAIVTQLAIKKTDAVLKNKVTSLTSSLNVQMKLNMESYMSRMETIATLAFGEKLAYTYDAAAPDNDKYEAINTEKIISEKLFSLCIMENFVDYGIVYRNNRTVGKISNGTSVLFGDKLFTELERMISDSRTEDGWFAGYENDFRRIYYVKRVHENALLFISFYSNELNDVFDNPETLSDMEIRLLNQDYNIIYSKDRTEIGSHLPDKIMSMIEGQVSASVLDNQYLVSVNKCGEWYVVCSIPTKIIFAEKNEMTWYIRLTGAIAASIAAFIGFYLSHLLTRPVRNIVTELDSKAHTDRLTGILNKLAFEEMAGSCLENTPDNEHKALIIFDLDYFKTVNDTLGHAVGDRLLEHIGKLLKATFSEDDYMGRIGGDEFCVLINRNYSSTKELRDDISVKCYEFKESVRQNEILSGTDVSVSSSIGIAVFPDDAVGFKELYKACDSALYRSKNTGKNKFTFYTPDMKSEGSE